jgi:hypothetical protein
VTTGNLVDRSIQIRFRCGGREVNAFWVSLKAGGDVSVGSSDRTMRVQRIGPNGPLGNSKTVENPHVTFHPPNWTHLVPNKGAALWQALTWAAPEPGAPPASWIEIITSPIKTLRDGQGRQGQTVEVWPLACSDDSKSACLLVDFASAQHAQENRVPQDRYLAWGDVTLRFRLGTLDGQDASINVHTWG